MISVTISDISKRKFNILNRFIVYVHNYKKEAQLQLPIKESYYIFDILLFFIKKKCRYSKCQRIVT